MEDVKYYVRKNMWKGFGLVFIKAFVDKSELVKSTTLYLFNKQVMSIALANDEWTKEDGTPYKFKLDKETLFVNKLAVTFGRITV